ncbi:MAG: hypothetical protein Q9226_004967 [Calogaya cf. arnoldii]
MKNSAITHLKDVLAWIGGADPTTRYTNALKGRHTGTGSWYIDGRDFDRWTKEPNSISWLWGIPGCGKTVLSATIIERLTGLCSHDQDHVLAYFYFSFDDQAFQKVDGMIRSIATQLCSQCTSIPHCVESLYSKCTEGRSQPLPLTSNNLREMLCQLFGCFSQVYIVLDALDECTERHDLVPVLEEFAGWHKPELHLLTTSRKEVDLEQCMGNLTNEADRIGIQGMAVAADISSYVLGRLRTDRRLKRWHKAELEKEIVETLTLKAHERFQWVVCQLNTLARCRSISELRKALLSLPKDLDDTYARILKTIDDEEDYAHVFKILQLLVGSNEPVTIDEAAETIPIELDSTPQVHLVRRLVDCEDVLSMCSALVILETQEDKEDFRGKRTVLRLAHFSIREFLLSTRIQESAVSHWQMDDISSHLFIARLFIAYVLFLEVDIDECAGYGNELSYKQFYLDYPLAEVAISRWSEHLSIPENNDAVLASGGIGSQLFTLRNADMRSWLPQLFLSWHCGPCSGLLQDEIWDDVGIKQDSLFFTAHHNLPQTTGFLLARGANPNTLFDIDQGHRPSLITPLAEASRLGHVKVVKELLTHQADVEFEPEGSLNALKQACLAGNTEVVRLLLDHGADPNARVRGNIGPCWSRSYTALGAALEAGLAKNIQPPANTAGLVKMLLEAGGNVTDPFETNCWPIEISPIEFAATKIRDPHVIEILLDHGADGVDGLVASAGEGLAGLVLPFLHRGIDVNVRASETSDKEKQDFWPPWTGRTALERACIGDDFEVVRILLGHGADPNIRSAQAESALEAYFNRRHPECLAAPIFVLLLGSGADLELVRESKLHGDKIPQYLAILDRWRAWKADDSISPIQVIGDYRRKFDKYCPSAVARSKLRDEVADRTGPSLALNVSILERSR